MYSCFKSSKNYLKKKRMGLKGTHQEGNCLYRSSKWVLFFSLTDEGHTLLYSTVCDILFNSIHHERGSCYIQLRFGLKYNIFLPLSLPFWPLWLQTCATKLRSFITFICVFAVVWGSRALFLSCLSAESTAALSGTGTNRASLILYTVAIAV